MPSAEGGKKENWGRPLAPVGDPQKNLPPWDRANPSYGVGAGKEEQANQALNLRVTTRELRDIQKIVQHRKIPAIETQTDVVRIGLVMVRYWYALHHKTPTDVDQLDIMMWEQEVAVRKRKRERIRAVLDGIDEEFADALRLKVKSRLVELKDEINQYRKQIPDDALRTRASKLFIDLQTAITEMKPGKP